MMTASGSSGPSIVQVTCVESRTISRSVKSMVGTSRHSSRTIETVSPSQKCFERAGLRILSNASGTATAI
jgi:hypothetical protein